MFRKASIGDCLQIYGLLCDLENRELPFDRFQREFILTSWATSIIIVLSMIRTAM